MDYDLNKNKKLDRRIEAFRNLTPTFPNLYGKMRPLDTIVPKGRGDSLDPTPDNPSPFSQMPPRYMQSTAASRGRARANEPKYQSAGLRSDAIPGKSLVRSGEQTPAVRSGTKLKLFRKDIVTTTA